MTEEKKKKKKKEKKDSDSSSMRLGCENITAENYTLFSAQLKDDGCTIYENTEENMTIYEKA